MEGKLLAELPYDAEFLNALGELEMRIIEDYNKFSNKAFEDSSLNETRKEEFAASIAYLPGRSYLKVIKKLGHQTMVWGFINLKNKKFKEGDLLKAAGYGAPALNKPRGNIFDSSYAINWTGPKYLSGYCAGGKRNGGLL